jgi:hypothetical protein
MPYKHNENRRHKIKKSRYKVTNSYDYNNGLRQRGDVTIWFTEAAIADWHGCVAKFFEIRDNAWFLAIEKPND